MSPSLIDVLGRVRTPSEPGPGPITFESLRALDLVIGRRVSALMSGDYRSVFTGIGTELHQVRPYQPGDDVRRIDWNVTARTGHPHVRVELAERVLVTWVVLDASASMAFGTADRRKADVAEGVSIAIAHLASRRGNRLGVVTFGAGRPRFRLPREGRRELLVALGLLQAAPAGGGGLSEALTIVRDLSVHRSLVVVISDFRGPRDWEAALGHVAERHPTLAVEIRDPREDALTDIGELVLREPETGRRVVVDTHDPTLRAEYAEAAAEERRIVANSFASLGTAHVVISTEGDWLRGLASFLNTSRHR